MQIVEGVVSHIDKKVTESYHPNSTTWRKHTQSFLSLDTTYAWYQGGIEAQAGDKLILIGKQKQRGFSIAAYYNLSQRHNSIDSSEHKLLYLLAAIFLLFGILAGYGAFTYEAKSVGFFIVGSLLFLGGFWFLLSIYQNNRMLKRLSAYLQDHYPNLLISHKA